MDQSCLLAGDASAWSVPAPTAVIQFKEAGLLNKDCNKRQPEHELALERKRQVKRCSCARCPLFFSLAGVTAVAPSFPCLAASSQNGEV